MPQFVPVSRERHGTRHWRRYASYGFARTRAVLPLAGAELARAALAFPIAFLNEAEAYVPVAVLSLDPARNLFVAPDGRWLGSYVPAALRSHPFALAPRDGGDLVLCIDEAAGLLSDDGTAEPFFDPDGAVAEPTRKVMEFLTSVEQSRATARTAAAALAEAGLIVPWDITVSSDTGQRKVAGLYKLDEGALNALPMERFETLRQAGAVALAYCQILSMQHLPALGRLAEAHAQQQRDTESVLKDALTDPGDGQIDIDWTAFGDQAAEKDKP